MAELNKQFFKDMLTRLVSILRWLGVGILSGIIIGGISTLFAFCLKEVTGLRITYTWITYLLPVAGLAIAGIYKLLKSENDRGTNVVFASISADDDVPAKMAPLIFISTVLSHLGGASVGREGAALQLGGSLGNTIGKGLRFDKADRKIMIMCGMSASFAAIFGTPVAAAVFAVEVATVGVMYYSALFPCIVSALVARLTAQYWGFAGESYEIINMPSSVTLTDLGKCIILGVLCGVVAIAFCMSISYMKKLTTKLFKNAFLRAAVVGIVFVVITHLLGTMDYDGAGTDLISRAIDEGRTVPYAFALKLVLTALVIGGGYRGGEIVPSFCIGATFGCFMGGLLGLSPSLGAALGMTAVFCGVTNCPISAMLISFELFGFESAPYVMIVSGVSYVASGYVSLYSDQVFLHSKYRQNVIHRKLLKEGEAK